MNALDRIESELSSDDPRFVARMRTMQRPSPTPWVLAGVLYVALPLIALLFGPATAVITLGVAGALITGLVLFRRL